jgi:putative DNA primase/helicase
LSKFTKLVPALALLFELAELGADGSEGIEGLQGGGCVSYHYLYQAVEFSEYLESHARRLYSCVASPEKHAAVLLGERIKNREIGGSGYFTLREVQQKDWKGLNSSEKVHAALALLDKAGWIRDATERSGPQGGRPSIRYEVNTRIWD